MLVLPVFDGMQLQLMQLQNFLTTVALFRGDLGRADCAFFTALDSALTALYAEVIPVFPALFSRFFASLFSIKLNVLLSLFFSPSGFFLLYCIFTILLLLLFSISLLSFSMSQRHLLEK